MLESSLFRALADPTRRSVFESLSEREWTVGELTSQFDVSQPAISQHLSALREAGLVLERREGRNAFYKADPRGLVPLAKWVERYRITWPARITKLKRVLKEIDK